MTSSKFFFQRHPRITFITFLFSLTFVPCSIEFTLYLFLHYPSLNLFFPYFEKTISSIYYEHELDFVQYLPQCAQYDSELFYILKPGECQHHSTQFNCNYSINTKGLRDDETSLEKPEVIVLGDSYAMGWGVDNSKIFSSLIEQQTKKKTLNVAVSSYGTAREFLMLNRIDISNLKYLVIQYCTNDFDENKQYVDDGFKLKIQSKEVYETIVRNHVNRIRYRPFLYLSTLLRIVGDHFLKNDEFSQKVSKAALGNVLASGKENVTNTLVSTEDSVRYFLKIVQSKPELEHVQIIVLNASGPFYTTPSFIHALSNIKNDESYPAFIRNIKTIDICGFVKTEDYFILDCHLNEEGHSKIANALVSLIKDN